MIFEYTTLLIIIVILSLIIAFLYIKDKQLLKDLSRIEEAIVEIKKGKINNSNSENAQNSDEIKELDSKIYELGESLIKIVRSMKNLDSNQEELKNKVESLEQKIKLSILSNSANSNTNEVLSMYKDGKTPEEIAKEKRIPLGEVELMIKLDNINDN